MRRDRSSFQAQDTIVHVNQYLLSHIAIEEELIKKIQRDFKGKFGREEERFQVERNLSEQLGPGYYTIDNNGS